jgi:hypothetical protein
MKRDYGTITFIIKLRLITGRPGIISWTCLVRSDSSLRPEKETMEVKLKTVMINI